MKALEQAGDRLAFPYVSKLAAGSKTDAEIRAAAHSCLTCLMAKEDEAQTLLRAADSTGMAAETLLRAAYKSPPAEPRQLLHVTTGKEEG